MRIGRSKLPTNQRTFIPASVRYRARAEGCRLQAQTFRDETAQAQMFQLAADYERKAMQAEVFEPKAASEVASMPLPLQKKQ